RHFSICVRVCVVGLGRRAVPARGVTTTLATSAVTASTLLIGIGFFHVAPLAGIHYVRKDHAEPGIERNAVPVAPADSAGKQHDVASFLPRRVRNGID